LAQIFSKKANRIPYVIPIILAALLLGATGFFWYYGSPWYTDVGYRPLQPIAYSHKLHAGDLGLDCRYCHSQIEKSAHANVPSTQTCMNCHRLIGQDNEKLLPVRESWANQRAIQWTRVHKLPDYAYFDHSAHLRAGINCINCHGNVANMDVVVQKKPLSMGWCLDCHRNPDAFIGPPGEVTNMKWIPGADHAEFVAQFKQEKQISPPESCSACHR
jgi:hypothetical protein